MKAVDDRVLSVNSEDGIRIESSVNLIMPRITKPVKKLLGVNAYTRKVFNLGDRETAGFEKLVRVTYWLECREFDEGCLYSLNSNPPKYAQGFRGFDDMEEAIDCFLEYIS